MPLCKNIVQHGLAESVDCYLQHISCRDARLFDLAEPGDLFRKHDRLEAAFGTCSKKEFLEREKSMGVNFCRTGVLGDRELRQFVVPERVHTYDNMHNLLSNGAAHWEIALLLRHLGEVGVGRETLQSFVDAAWTWPCDKARKGNMMKDAFSEHRISSDGHYKAMASEILVLYPLLRHLLLNVVLPTGMLQLPIRSFLALCRTLDMTHGIKLQRACSAEVLLQAIQAHLAAFVQAYGRSEVKPKHHFELHIPSQVQRDDGLLLDTYVQERKHQLIKRNGETICFTKAMGQSTLARAVQDQLRELDDPGWTPGLHGRQTPFRELDLAAVAAPRLRTRSGVWVGIHDLVWADDALAQVRACAEVGGEFYVVISYLQNLRAATDFAWAGGKVARSTTMVASDRVRQTICWTRRADGDYLVLV